MASMGDTLKRMRKPTPRRFIFFDFKNKRVAVLGPKPTADRELSKAVEMQRQFAASSSGARQAS
jgi:hypothetical protein